MDTNAINFDLFKKLSLTIAIIRNTPDGITPDVFTRLLSKRLFPQSTTSQMSLLHDEHLILRQQDLLSRLAPAHTRLTSSTSLMDVTTISTNDRNNIVTNEYVYGEFAEKILRLNDRQNQIKVDHVEFLFNTLTTWIVTMKTHHEQIIPIDACFYMLQLIACHLKTDDNKPYHVMLDLLLMVDKFVDNLFDHITDKNIDFIHQIVIILASSDSCVSRVLNKVCNRLRLYAEKSDIHDEMISTNYSINLFDRTVVILHEIVHCRSIFQSRLSQRTIDRLFMFINQLSSLLEGKPSYTHLLKLEGQLQAANYRTFEPSKKVCRIHTSLNSSDCSQYQIQQRYASKPPLPTISKNNSLDYSMSQLSQSQLFFN